MPEKKVPNPNGKKGGEKHQQKVKEVFADVRKRGFKAKLEHFLKLISGQGRFMDVAEIDNGTEIMYHQIGKQTKKGLPVKRERDVIEEVENDKNIPITFHPYNLEDKDNDGSSD